MPRTAVEEFGRRVHLGTSIASRNNFGKPSGGAAAEKRATQYTGADRNCADEDQRDFPGNSSASDVPRLWRTKVGLTLQQNGKNHP